MKRGTCRGCGAPIVWIRTTAGRYMPCDASPVRYKPRSGGAGKVVTPRGEVLSCELDAPPAEACCVGYVSHFATCPQAGRFHRSGATAKGEG